MKMNYSKKNFLEKNNIKILIIVRLASKRLKGKAKLKINNLSLIEILILRLLKYFKPKQIIICTSKKQNNNFFKKILRKYSVNYFAGSDKNIFKRIIDCQKRFKFKNFVRVTGDNPLTDAKSIIDMSNFHINNKNDFTFTNSLAKGMRPEIISMKALIKASNLANDQLSSEYLTYFFLRKSFKFKKIILKKYLIKENNISVTIDYKKDFNLMKRILKNNIYKTRKEIILDLKDQKISKSNNKRVLTKNKFYDVSFKNDDQQILL